MKLSDIIGNRVCSIYEGKFLGYILNCISSDDNRRITSFLVVNDDDDFEYLLQPKDIVENNDGIFFVKNQSCLSVDELDQTRHSSFINKPAYYLDGEEIGKIVDVEITSNYELENLIIGDNTIPASKVFTLGDDVCLIFRDKRPKISKFAPQKPKIMDVPVKILQIPQTPPNPPSSNTKLPQKLTAYDSLTSLGKIATRTVLGKNNEIIIKKGEIVSMDTVKKAKQHLVYLSF